MLHFQRKEEEAGGTWPTCLHSELRREAGQWTTKDEWGEASGDGLEAEPQRSSLRRGMSVALLLCKVARHS